MNYLNNEFKLSRFFRKSKKKYDKILQNSKEQFPSFLSTEHHYKKRKSLLFDYPTQKQISPINIKSSQKNETNLLLSKLASQRSSIVSNDSTIKPDNSGSTLNNLLESNNNPITKKRVNGKKHRSSIYINSLSVENDKKIHRKKTLTNAEKIKLREILENFKKNKLTTNHLYKQEKKLSLNSLTESNFLFLFTNYKNKSSNKSKMKHLLLNKTPIEKMSKSSLLSFNMMKNFNKKTDKIYEEEKLEGIKFSKNVNEFRKQIINSYKDSFNQNDINQEKLNYNNAIQLITNNQERQIKKAYQLEREFYKTKYNESDFTNKENDYMDNYMERKRNRTSTHKFGLNTFSSKLNKFRFSYAQEEDFNENNDEKIFDYAYINKESRSYSHSNKKELLSNRKISNDANKKESQNLEKLKNNNIYLNYMRNIYEKRRKKNSIIISSKEDYKNYVRKTLKDRAKEFADSLFSINNYYEYQPLIDIKTDMAHLNVNDINLKRVIKVNEIRKNLFSSDDDDLLIHNVNKLKEQLRDVELQYYSIDRYNKKYNLSFVKNNVKRKTIEKLNSFKNPRFGVPC